MESKTNLSYLCHLTDCLKEKKNLSDEEFLSLLSEKNNREFNEYLYKTAREIKEKYYEKKIYIRGLIEFTNFCKNNCYYCGIRLDNKNTNRYRLNKEDILSCCKKGYSLGIRTFVLQGGEDAFFTDNILSDIISSIKKLCPDCAVTLSIGERTTESYERLFNAGADRYLLRHETADVNLYNALHPKTMSYDNRIECIKNLKSIGYQIGCGMMIGSPGQSLSHLLKDIRFLQQINPDMVGIGPFIPHHDTVYANEKPGTLEMTLNLLSIIRLILPYSLLPATTALGTIDPNGREKGFLAGANVIMPNLSPQKFKKNYLLYDNKISDEDDAEKVINNLSARISDAGYRLTIDRGDRFGI